MKKLYVFVKVVFFKYDETKYDVSIFYVRWGVSKFWSSSLFSLIGPHFIRDKSKE